MIEGVTHAATQTGDRTSVAMEGLGKDAFLKLLVAQMRHQNPLNPTDSQEYLAQAAQFAQIERLEQMSRAQGEAVAYQQVLLSASLVGREVTGVPAGGGEPVTGVVTSVRFTGGVPTLQVGDHEIAVGQVQEVRPAPTAEDPVDPDPTTTPTTPHTESESAS